MDRHQSADEAETFEKINRAGRRGNLLGKVNQRFQEALQTNRGDERVRDVARETTNDPGVSADDLAMKRAKSVKAQRMIVPEGVIIEGALSSGSETEIEGRIDGNVTVDGHLYLGRSALVSGNVRASNCKLDGLVEGRMDCANELELGQTGRLNADVMAGKSMELSGQVNGNVTCGGSLRILAGADVRGDVRSRVFYLEEGGIFNGTCSIGNKPKPPAARAPEKREESGVSAGAGRVGNKPKSSAAPAPEKQGASD